MKRNGHKFNAKPTVVDGIRFSSKAEAKRYGELKMLEKAGKIESLELQPVFPLRVLLTTGSMKGAAQALAGEYPTIGKYVADFKYFRNDAPTGWVIEDVKSPATKTPIYRFKKKFVEAQYGITITEVMIR